MRPAPTLYIVIPGECPPAPRPRFSIAPVRSFAQAKKAGTMRELLACFRPKPYRDEKHPYVGWKKSAAVLMDSARNAYCGTAPFVAKGAPVEVRILIVTPLPKTKERKTIEVVRDWCVAQRKGDADNLAKGPLDAALGVLWYDDSQVASLTIEKVVGAQGEGPRCEIMIWPLERQDAQRTNFEQTRMAVRGTGQLFEPATEGGADQCRPPQTETIPF